MTIKRVGRPGDIDCSGDVPLVKQEFADDCNVNIIIARCLRNGAPLPVHSNLEPIFADVSEVGDYRDVVERVRKADEAFMRLDAGVRTKFGNDPGLLMAFLQDPSKREEAIAMGLVVPLKAPEAPPAPSPKPKPKAGKEVTPEES